MCQTCKRGYAGENCEDGKTNYFYNHREILYLTVKNGLRVELKSMFILRIKMYVVLKSAKCCNILYV